jgi:hypothetical protein
LPPIADHDIVYIECITILLSDWLKGSREISSSGCGL